MSPLLTAERVSYRVGPKALVSEVSLALSPGRLTAMVGPNGAGKSTLVKLLSGEIPPASGRVRIDGEDLARIPGWRLACLRAVLPQASRLSFPFTAAEIVRIGLDGIGRGLSGADRARLLAEALDQADVAHLARRAYQSLSGGEQQRVQFARVLAQLAAGRTVAARQILVLDEPIASLDLKHQLALLEHAGALARESVAVLAVLHDLNLASVFADEIVVMSGGRAVAQGPPAEVIHDRMVREVFDVDLPVGIVPDRGRPFILPRRSGAGSPPA